MPDRPSLPVLYNLLGQFTMSPWGPAWPPSAWQFTMSPSASPYVPLGLPKLLGQFTMSPRPPQNFSRQHTGTDFCYSLQPAQKLGLLGGKLFLRQDAFALQFGQLLDLCEDIRFLSRVGAVWLGWCLCLCRGVLDHAINGDDGQARDRDGPVLTGEGERASCPLLLRDAADLVVERVVDGHVPIDLHGQPPRVGEVRVANVVLGAGPARETQARRPPVAGTPLRQGDEQADRRAAANHARAAIASLLLLLLSPRRLRLARQGERHEGLLFQDLRKLGAQTVDLGFQAVIEHIADHGHAALQPLAAAAQLRVVELCHGPVAVNQRMQQSHHGIGTDPVALSQFVDPLPSLFGEFLQSQDS